MLIYFLEYEGKIKFKTPPCKTLIYINLEFKFKFELVYSYSRLFIISSYLLF